MRAFRIGILLGFRQIQRASKWTTILIVFVMMFTFLNLIAVSGILVGLIEGAIQAVREESLGDILISPLAEEDHILETQHVTRTLDTFDEISSYSTRYIAAATIEANYKERRDLGGERDIIATNITGIDPVRENEAMGLGKNINEGEYLNPEEQEYLLIGKYYVDRYAEQFGDIFDSLENIVPGSPVRVTIGDVTKEFIVKGIVDSKVDQVSFNAYIPEKEFRRMALRADLNADQIAIRLKPGFDEYDVQRGLQAAGLETYAKIETFIEAEPKFVTDIKNTFDLLGTFIGSIGIVVASITIFIIIFINALSRRRHIGILKGIGIERNVIEFAYVIQAAFYALVGSLFGAVLTYAFLIPYFNENPIHFPFSDGILVAEPESTFVKFVVLFIITLVAGFLPAWLIVRQNTLNSILGRK